VFKGFTASFALELFEIREMFELRSAKAFARLPETSKLWQQIEALREEHISLLQEIDRRYHDFSDLDNRFHHLVNSAVPNRFIDSFYDIITLIFHYLINGTSTMSASATKQLLESTSRTSKRCLVVTPPLLNSRAELI
jgi:DNA-binding GntR family transcriptional regulator